MNATIQSKAGLPCIVRYKTPVVVQALGKPLKTTVQDGAVSFKSAQRKTYVITPLR